MNLLQNLNRPRLTILMYCLFALFWLMEVYMASRLLNGLVDMESPKADETLTVFGSHYSQGVRVLVSGFVVWSFLWVAVFISHNRPLLAIVLKVAQIALIASPFAIGMSIREVE